MSAPDADSEFDANSMSANHHSTMMVYLSATFMTILAVFSGGAFTAMMNILASDLGRNAMKSNVGWTGIAAMACFGSSFILVMLATFLLIIYSYKSWNDHREAIHQNDRFTNAHKKTTGGHGAAVVVAFSFGLMVMGAILIAVFEILA